jgi:hypothetical protein
MLRHRRLVERRPHVAGKFYRVVIGPKVDEEHPRLFVEHVTVDRGHLDIAGAQRADQRIDLVAGDQEIAGDGGLSATGRLEIDRVAPPSAVVTCMPPSVAGSRRGMPN